MGSSISEEQVRLLKEHCPDLRFVTVMLDGDEPGREAAQKVAARIAQNWWTRIAHYPTARSLTPSSAPISCACCGEQRNKHALCRRMPATLTPGWKVGCGFSSGTKLCGSD